MTAFAPIVLSAGSRRPFPDPERADAEGLLAIGGDLGVERLLTAYGSGIFPWYDDGLPPLWWSPDPRAVLTGESLHLSRSLKRRLRSGRFVVTLDRDFEGVMRGCAAEREHGTWILPEMIEAYCALHEHGHAHSFEVWHEARLVGGLYGVSIGGLFAAESMFHRATDASKVALAAAVSSCFEAGVSLFDVQFVTPHLATLGAFEVPRFDYLQRLGAARGRTVNTADLARMLDIFNNTFGML